LRRERSLNDEIEAIAEMYRLQLNKRNVNKITHEPNATSVLMRPLQLKTNIALRLSVRVLAIGGIAVISRITRNGARITILRLIILRIVIKRKVGRGGAIRIRVELVMVLVMVVMVVLIRQS
jgi:hypothetical protein